MTMKPTSSERYVAMRKDADDKAQARLADLEALARDVADADLWSDDFRCLYCNAHALDPHAEDCLRRRAVELMKGR